MYSHTKRVGSVGRYGPRIGRKIRYEVRQIEDNAKENRCPNCSKSVKRQSSGIWMCRFCSLKFTGDAYFTTGKKTAISG